MVLELMTLGSIAAASGQWARKRALKERAVRREPSVPDAVGSPELRRNGQRLAAASAALGLSAASVLLRTPVLGYVSVPVSLFAFLPVLANAGRSLGKERAINDQVLAATRAAICVAMGYYCILALDATLQSAGQRLFLRQEDGFRKNLKQAAQQHGLVLPVDMPLQPDRRQIHAEQTAERAAPWMLGFFVLTIPMMGVNRAAAFLTTTFGGHLRNLGPYTSRRVIHAAMQEGIVLMQPDALESAAQVDTLVIDSRLLEGLPQEEVHGLIDGLQRQYRVQVLDAAAQHISFGELQASGNKVAYLHGPEDELGRQAAFLCIACGNRAAQVTSAPILLLGDGIRQLPVLLALANTFTQRQRFNFIAPIGVDLMDIATTVFLDFGLIYSVLFTYTGLGLGVVNNHLEKCKGNPISEQELLPVPAPIR
ncbi:hypothetical protein Thini_4347 [Thiothrix nivea DSM 5205]|uniref:Uncharacterized protein n=1 Tax=Thiothrix nivea (strain ATCC 35100 / DSM 5205 / JP2) TaxID=870187 RepID=A0A656HIS5_THINJ|nr:hypothetical protein Thini_4347 [Thiothrix nivea DSM 5205]